MDSRAINKITIKYRFLIPRLDDLSDMMVDMMVGLVSSPKLIFRVGITRSVSARVRTEKLPLRLKMVYMSGYIMRFDQSNAPNTFMRVMAQILSLYLGKIVVVYFDNILVFSRIQEEYLLHLTHILETP